jgi:phosphatidylserine decarboxylase
VNELDLRGRLLMGVLRATPRHALTRVVGQAAGWTEPRAVARLAIRGFARRYALNLDEASLPIESYDSVRALFTRALRAGARTIAPGEQLAVSPVDGRVSAMGLSEGGELLQIKGVRYSLRALVADELLAQALSGGPYATLYLAPQDYHRVHASLAGKLKSVTYIPGELWPVNPVSVASVPGLFALNERLVFDFETAVGRCALVMVGATIVGRLRATLGGVEPFQMRPRRLERRVLEGGGLEVAKGEQIGIFDMGSTVVVCFAPGRIRLKPMAVGERVWLGQPLADEP